MSHQEVGDEVTNLFENLAISSVDGPSEDDFILNPNEYEIVAFADITLVTKDVSEEDIREKFGHSKVELHPLRIGADCMWVARRRVAANNTKDEMLVLPFIAFKDDKLLREKTRSQCNDYGFKKVLRIKEASSSPLSDSVHVAYNIHRIDEFNYFETVTGNQVATLEYLADLTLGLNKSFKEKALRSCQRVFLPHTFSHQPDTIPLITWEEFSSFP